MNATGMPQNETATPTGGGIARKARQQMESRTGKSVVTPENALPTQGRKALKNLKPVNKTEDEASS